MVSLPSRKKSKTQLVRLLPFCGSVDGLMTGLGQSNAISGAGLASRLFAAFASRQNVILDVVSLHGEKLRGVR